MSDQSAPFLDRVRQTIGAHQMLALQARVLVAVSGGPDSIALLHALRELGYDVVAAHLDHMTRDGESAQDAAFVESLAGELSIQSVVERHPVEADSDSGRESFEQAARRIRYEFLERAAKAHKCDAIATGHNADDVAETVLWRILRGTSVEGIGGIPPVRELKQSRVVRPIIACPRDAIVEYLTVKGIAYRRDSSNDDLRFLRNRIRHELIPLLEREYNPRVREALVRLATLARDDSTTVEESLASFIDACMNEEPAIDRARFSAGLPALQRRALHAFALQRGVDLTFERTEAAREFIATGRTGAKLEIGGALLINRANSTAWARDFVGHPPVEMAVPGQAEAFGRCIAARILRATTNGSWSSYCTPSRQVFDADILGAEVRIRPREVGDRFTPLGMEGTRKLQDYFVDAGVPQDERDRVPIIEAGGRIAWIVGGAIDAAFAVTDATKRIVELEVTDAPE